MHLDQLSLFTSLLGIAFPCLLLFLIERFIRTSWVPNRFREAIRSVSSKNPFAFVDLKLNRQEAEAFANLKINKTAIYERYSDLHLLEKELPQFFKELGNSYHPLVIQASSALIRLTKQIIEASGQQTGWLAIRANLPSDIFDIARWHIDGNYYAPYSIDSHPKFVATLKGPSTLFYPANLQEKHEVHERCTLTTSCIENRQYLASLFDPENIVRPKEGQGVFFTVGSAENAAVHSEPPLSEPRMVMALVLGSYIQIAERQRVNQEAELRKRLH